MPRDLADDMADPACTPVRRLQVKIAGERIELGDVESTIVSSGLVKVCVVLARKDIVPGQPTLVAYVEANGTGDAALKNRLWEFCDGEMPRCQRPQVSRCAAPMFMFIMFMLIMSTFPPMPMSMLALAHVHHVHVRVMVYGDT